MGELKKLALSKALGYSAAISSQTSLASPVSPLRDFSRSWSGFVQSPMLILDRSGSFSGCCIGIIAAEAAPSRGIAAVYLIVEVSMATRLRLCARDQAARLGELFQADRRAMDRKKAPPRKKTECG